MPFQSALTIVVVDRNILEYSVIIVISILKTFFLINSQAKHEITKHLPTFVIYLQ